MSDKKNTEEKPAEIATIDERTIRDKIYEVRDAGVKLTTAISEMMSEDMKKHMHELIDKMKKNPPLVLK